MSRRDLRDALAVFGRSTVAEAVARRPEARAYWLAHAREFQAAIRGLRVRLPDLTAAGAFVEALPPPMRRALAAAWIGEVQAEVAQALGLGEPPADAGTAPDEPSP